MATTGKIVEVLFEQSLEAYEEQVQMLNLVNFIQPDGATMQNAGDVIWKPVQQHAPVISGWDLTDDEQEIIEETYPCILGTPQNDLVEQRADKMRDLSFWEARGKESGKQQATDLNKRIADAIKAQSGMYYRANVTDGFAFISEAQALMNERQLYNSERFFMLGDRDNQLFGKDLAGRETVRGRPEEPWKTGQIGSKVADFDVYTGSFLGTIAGGATVATVVTDADQSFAPEGGSVNTGTGVVTNVDYRTATVTTDENTGYAVGNKIKFTNDGTDVMALGLADKTNTGIPMTFTVIAIVSDTSITIYPKPIALDDATLTDTEKAYANIDTVILDDAVVNRVNLDTLGNVNLFWEKSAIEVIGGTIPAALFSQFDGKKVIHDTLSNGLEMYMLYDGDIVTMNFRFRIFTWAGITVADPSNCGVAVTY